MNYQGKPGSSQGIEWLQPSPPVKGFTWNPGTGCGNTWCEVKVICWAGNAIHRQGGDFTPTFHPDRLMEPLHRKTPSLIAIWLMGDGFSMGVDAKWIAAILDTVRKTPQHVYLWLTKCPYVLLSWSLEEYPNLWVGTSVTGPEHADRIRWLCHPLNKAHHRFLSIEPFRHPFTLEQCQALFWSKWGPPIDWILIGGQSRPWLHPEHEWVDLVIRAANLNGTPVLVKRNANYASGPHALWDGTREWPRAILKHLQPKVGGEP